MTNFPLVLGEVEVRAARRVSPSFVRIELGGDRLADLGVSGGWRDQRFKIIFPPASGVLPPLSATADWYTDWVAIDEDERGAMRTYTVRDVVGEGDDTRLVLDVVVHDPGEHGDCTGPGNDWARTATVGDRVALVAPRRGFEFGGIEFQPPAGARELLIVGDETAAPAVYGILRDLPRDARGVAFLEVPVSDDVLDDVRGPEGVEVVWLPRDGRERGLELCERVLARLGTTGAAAPLLPSAPALATEPAAELDADGELMPWETPDYSAAGEDVSGEAPTEGPFAGLYAWIAGESKVVTGLRRALVKDLGVGRHQVAFMGYWREGVAMRA